MSWPKGKPNPRPRKYVINDAYFDRIDTEAKAYFLGLFCADGYMSGRDTNQFGMDLDVVDYATLELYRTELGHPTPPRKVKGSMFRVMCTSERIVKRFNDLGIHIRKSHNLADLKIDWSLDMVRHFVRGHFDGDGCWCVTTMGANNPKRYLAASIRATPAFCDYLAELMKPIHMNYTFSKTGILYSKRAETVKALGDWLYTGASIYMARKFYKYTAYMSGTKILGNQAGNPEVGNRLQV